MGIREVTDKVFDGLNAILMSVEYRSRMIRTYPGGFESMLRELSSVEGVSNAVRQAVDLGLTTRPEHIKAAIKVYESENDFCGAMELARTAKDEKQANVIYEKGLAFYRAHNDFWGIAIMAEDAGHYKVAMEHYEKVGDFRHAGRMANMLGNPKKAKAYETLADLLG